VSSDSGERTFDAPPSRIAKARREGNVPRAQEFSGNLAFVAAALGVCAIAPPLGATARAALLDASRGSVAIGPCIAIATLALVPAALAAASGIAGSLFQSGGLVLVAPAIKFDRLHPLEGIKRMLSREALTHGARALVAFMLGSAAMLPALRDLASAGAVALTPQSVAQMAWNDAQRVVWAAAAVGLLFAIAEYGVARRTWLRKLRMSLSELKRELKESDGDPLARSRRKTLHRNLVRGALAKVKEAAFVVVNPTHVAIALDYRPPAVPVPTILVRASDEMALRVRKLAREAGVPVIENIALARALFRDGAVGEPIAHEHYVAVAEVVASLLRSGALQ
jgi:flagellar biosynthesis protein FlhB